MTDILDEILQKNTIKNSQSLKNYPISCSCLENNYNALIDVYYIQSAYDLYTRTEHTFYPYYISILDC